MNTHSKFLMALLAALLLAGCGGSGPSGTYTGSAGSITFASGRADVKLAGTTREMPYSVDGNKIVLHSEHDGDIVLTLYDDGYLTAPWGRMRRAGSPGASHTYRSKDGTAMVTFAGGKMTMTMTGNNKVTFSAPYTVSGNKISVQGPQGTAVSFTRHPDGSLTAQGGKRKLIPVN